MRVKAVDHDLDDAVRRLSVSHRSRDLTVDGQPHLALLQVVLDASALGDLRVRTRLQVTRTPDGEPDQDDRGGAQERGGGAPGHPRRLALGGIEQRRE